MEPEEEQPEQAEVRASVRLSPGEAAAARKYTRRALHAAARYGAQQQDWRAGLLDDWQVGQVERQRPA